MVGYFLGVTLDDGISISIGIAYTSVKNLSEQYTSLILRQFQITRIISKSE